MTWTPVTFERLEPGVKRSCQYVRQETDNPCGPKTPDPHDATYQKVSRMIVDGRVLKERVVYLCTNARCAEVIKLTSHLQSEAK